MWRCQEIPAEFRWVEWEAAGCAAPAQSLLCDRVLYNTWEANNTYVLLLESDFESRAPKCFYSVVSLLYFSKGCEHFFHPWWSLMSLWWGWQQLSHTLTPRPPFSTPSHSAVPSFPPFSFIRNDQPLIEKRLRGNTQSHSVDMEGRSTAEGSCSLSGWKVTLTVHDGSCHRETRSCPFASAWRPESVFFFSQLWLSSSPSKLWKYLSDYQAITTFPSLRAAVWIISGIRIFSTSFSYVHVTRVSGIKQEMSVSLISVRRHETCS